MRIVEPNEHRSRIGVFLSENFPVEPRSWDVFVLVEENIFLIVVNIAVLEDPVGPGVDINFLAETEGELSLMFIYFKYETFYLMESSRELYSKLFQFPLLNDWN